MSSSWNSFDNAVDSSTIIACPSCCTMSQKAVKLQRNSFMMSSCDPLHVILCNASCLPPYTCGISRISVFTFLMHSFEVSTHDARVQNSADAAQTTICALTFTHVNKMRQTSPVALCRNKKKQKYKKITRVVQLVVNYFCKLSTFYSAS